MHDLTGLDRLLERSSEGEGMKIVSKETRRHKHLALKDTVLGCVGQRDNVAAICTTQMCCKRSRSALMEETVQS